MGPPLARGQKACQVVTSCPTCCGPAGKLVFFVKRARLAQGVGLGTPYAGEHPEIAGEPPEIAGELVYHAMP